MLATFAKSVAARGLRVRAGYATGAGWGAVRKHRPRSGWRRRARLAVPHCGGGPSIRPEGAAAAGARPGSGAPRPRGRRPRPRHPLTPHHPLPSSVVDGLKYAKSHEWAKNEGGVATVGITDFAQSELGDVVYVELPEVGSEVAAGETYGVVESVKAASDVYSPVSGEVVEVNEALVDDPSKVNTDAFGGGWMMKVKVTGEGAGLMDAAAYKAHIDAAH